MDRVSNGPVAVEILAQKLGLSAEPSLHFTGSATGDNYAVTRASVLGDEAIDLTAQLSAYMAYNGFVAAPDTLFVIMAGGNDVRHVRDGTDGTTGYPVIDAAANQIGFIMGELISAGARSFLVVNSPDIGSIPETQIIASSTGDAEIVKRATKLSKRYRDKLHDVIEQVKEHDDVNVVLFDLFKVFNRLIRQADKNGFTNSLDACFSSVTYTFYPGCGYGVNFDQYVFFDEIHPISRVHAIFGNAFYQALTKKHKKHKKHDD